MIYKVVLFLTGRADYWGILMKGERVVSRVLVSWIKSILRTRFLFRFVMLAEQYMLNSTCFRFISQMYMENRIPKSEFLTFWIIIQFFRYSAKIIFVTCVKNDARKGDNLFLFCENRNVYKITVAMPRSQRQSMWRFQLIKF